MILRLPLTVTLPRKKKDDRVIPMNLNFYRNAHYQILNQAKISFKEQVWLAILDADIDTNLWVKYNPPPFIFDYIIYPGSSKAFDVANICSIIDKFTCDALVDLKIITNDNYKIIQSVFYVFGAIDRENPRCELEIMSVKNDPQHKDKIMLLGVGR